MRDNIIFNIIPVIDTDIEVSGIVNVTLLSVIDGLLVLSISKLATARAREIQARTEKLSKTVGHFPGRRDIYYQRHMLQVLKIFE